MLAAALAQRIEKTFEEKGRIHFNVGGAQALEDSLKLVRNHTGRSLVFAFMGGYHGRTLAASAITSSFRYRERYGHFGDRAQFIPFPYCFRCFYGQKKESCGMYCLKQFEKLFETEYYGVVNKKTNRSEFVAFYIEAVQGTGCQLTRAKLLESWSNLKDAGPTKLGGLDVTFPESFTPTDHQGSYRLGATIVKNGDWQVYRHCRAFIYALDGNATMMFFNNPCDQIKPHSSTHDRVIARYSIVFFKHPPVF